MHLDVWCCNSHGDLAKIFEETCPRSPAKKTYRNWKHFLPLVEMYLHKELHYCNEGNYCFKRGFQFCNANYILTVHVYIPTDPLGLINIVYGLHSSSDKLIFLVGYIVNCTIGQLGKLYMYIQTYFYDLYSSLWMYQQL